MRIAVTGASGNVGTAVLRALATIRPDDTVVGLSRRTPQSDGHAEPYRSAEWVQVDLARPESEHVLVETFSGVDVVVHLAIAFQPMRDRRYLREVNVGGTGRVARACARAGVAHLVHMSSSGVYAPGAYGRKVDESWPRTGVSASTYSMDKAAAEDVLDEFEKLNPGVVVARLRPGLIGQYEFGSALLRYALPDLIPSFVVDHVPVLPIDRAFAVPAVHADDIAVAVVRVLERRSSGPFNVGAPTPVVAQDVAHELGARIIPVPARLLTSAVHAGFTTHVLPIHHGWVALAFTTPMLDTTRAERELLWKPVMDGPDVLRETVRGMREGGATTSPALRERSAGDRVRSFLRRGFVSRGKPS
ncbi:NAD-dependent epimerase/dehydratase family protein [Rhodococcus sp. G-MC3]|uniref:NAD-dependent epimerase/dehydratase family protein n=1 Tax=Rhodococcus sp. G-MC3 TaxID=3046209 RepID=UPI0024B89B43|nr:NAD-dependent epimerase/dehydratase family protein [Rhodococcus sp. G-MC3]MDJ0394170.1 NAD-dependent epimerase/dehydratase family protein [Rhodococcus sp. G-MC3]